MYLCSDPTGKNSLNKHEDDAGILTMKPEMLKSLQHRFDNIEEIDKLILDPQFKETFHNNRDETVSEKVLIDNCKFSEHASSTTDLSVDSTEPPKKQLRSDSTTTTTDTNTTSTEDDNASSAPCSSKIWECFTELLQEVGATGNTSGSVEAMVDRYLSEPLIDYKSGDPLKWWNENKRRFPLLVNLTKRFLSAPPTSIPSERLLFAVGILYVEHVKYCCALINTTCIVNFNRSALCI